MPHAPKAPGQQRMYAVYGSPSGEYRAPMPEALRHLSPDARARLFDRLAATHSHAENQGRGCAEASPAAAEEARGVNEQQEVLAEAPPPQVLHHAIPACRHSGCLAQYQSIVAEASPGQAWFFASCTCHSMCTSANHISNSSMHHKYSSQCDRRFLRRRRLLRCSFANSASVSVSVSHYPQGLQPNFVLFAHTEGEHLAAEVREGREWLGQGDCDVFARR